MTTSDDASYPPAVRRLDERRGRQDGIRRIPSLSEVRRRQQEMEQNGGRLTAGYQLVLLSEMERELNATFPAFQRTGRAMLHELRQHRDRIEDATRRLREAEELLAAAAAPLTPEELLPRNPEEQRWDTDARRDRREVERARRIRKRREQVASARDRLQQCRTECMAVERRRDEALADFGVRAHHIKERYQRRISTYLDALARAHPEGRTLSPLLQMPDIPLPDWVPDATVGDQRTTRAGVDGEEE